MQHWWQLWHCNTHKKCQSSWLTSPSLSSATAILKAWGGCTTIGLSADRQPCLNWSRINPTLYSLCFAGKAKKSAICIHCLSNNHNSAQCPETQSVWPPQCTFVPPAYTSPVQGPSATASELCRLFNAKGESKCRYRRCRYLHACARCKGDHPQSACPSRLGRKQQYEDAPAPKFSRLY